MRDPLHEKRVYKTPTIDQLADLSLVEISRKAHTDQWESSHLKRSNILIGWRRIRGPISSAYSSLVGNMKT